MAYLTGKPLRDELEKNNLGNDPLIEEFIYKDTVNMIYAKPGDGKSVVTTNLAIAAITDGLIFNYLPSKIKKVAYWQTEGSRDEQLGRIQAMQRQYGAINCDRLSWHTTYVNIEEQRNWREILKEFDEVKPFDLLIIDPIYSLGGDGVLNEKFCTALRGFGNKIRNEFGSAILMNHHTPKDTINYKGEKVEKDTPMGLRWIDASLDGLYYFKQTSKEESFLECRKNRSSGLIERMVMKFDIANWSMKVIEDKSSVTATRKVRSFLIKKFSVNSFATTTEICRECSVSRRHLRRLKHEAKFDDIAIIRGDEKKEQSWSKKS